MKKTSFYLLFVALVSLLAFASCDNGGGDDPQPTTKVFTLQNATFNGSPISPTPSYSVTLNWDADGNANGYSVGSSNASQVPTVGNSGDFSVATGANTITFSNTAGDSRTVNITAGTITPSALTFTVQWELTKVDDGVDFEEEGTYVFEMQAQ